MQKDFAIDMSPTFGPVIGGDSSIGLEQLVCVNKHIHCENGSLPIIVQAAFRSLQHVKRKTRSDSFTMTEMRCNDDGDEEKFNTTIRQVCTKLSKPTDIWCGFTHNGEKYEARVWIREGGISCRGTDTDGTMTVYPRVQF